VTFGDKDTLIAVYQMNATLGITRCMHWIRSARYLGDIGANFQPKSKIFLAELENLYCIHLVNIDNLNDRYNIDNGAIISIIGIISRKSI
jgi:hypothetical protein